MNAKALIVANQTIFENYASNLIRINNKGIIRISTDLCYLLGISEQDAA